MPDVLTPEEFAARYGAAPSTFVKPPAPQPLTGGGMMPPGTAPGGMQPNARAPDASMVPLSANSQQEMNLMRVYGLMGDRAGVQSSQDILNADPTYLARKTQATDMGKNAALLASKQGAGTSILTGVDKLQDLISGADDDVLKGSMGPYNMSKVHPYTVTPLSPSAYLAPQDMTPPEAAQAYNPSEKNAKNWDFQNRMEHLIEGLTVQFIASTGGAGNNMSDARQQAFTDAMGRMRQATTKDEMMKIVDDARHVISNTFYIPPTIPVLSPEQARSAAPGTVFKTPDGRTLRVPGIPSGGSSFVGAPGP